MNKHFRIALLLITVAAGASTRLTIAGWLFIIGVLSIAILGTIHIIVHASLIRYDPKPVRTDWILTVLSHLFFLCLFLFQTDGGDDRSYVIIEYILNGRDNTQWDKYASTILIASLVGYFLVVAILLTRLKTRNIDFSGKRLRITLLTIFLIILVPIAGLFLLSGIDNRKERKRNEQEGNFEDLDRALRNKEKVKVLRLYKYPNSYTSVPHGVFELRELEELQMYSNEITEIPAAICSLKALRRLDLQYNRIRMLPPEIGKLTSLEELILINNEIDSISPAVCDCTKLRVLSIGGPSLQSIPTCLFGMRSLEKLVIQSDSINNFMESLSGLKQLKELKLYTYGNAVRDNHKYYSLSKILPHVKMDIPSYIMDSLNQETR